MSLRREILAQRLDKCALPDTRDTSDADAVRAAVTPATRALFVETLTNPLLKFADLGVLSGICREHDLLLIADNTFLTPYLLRPFDLGADITV